MHREGTGEETGGEIWDPIGISSTVSDEAMMWFRAAELKHGRVAMVRSATLWVWRGVLRQQQLQQLQQLQG